MAKKADIPTKALAGFMELLPAGQILFDYMKDTIRQTYERFGFVPIDTPVIERTSVLFAKAGGETEKQIYRIQRETNDQAMRFDLTVPLARYVSEHFSQLTFPFRRYAIGKVFRGERNQRGRFKEFYQCDIDIIGDGHLNLINDAEIPSIIYTTFQSLGFGKFTIKINNRKILNGLFSALNLSDKRTEIMREIDKIEKTGPDSVQTELLKLEIDETAVGRIMDFIAIKGSNKEILEKLSALDLSDDGFKLGVDELTEVTRYIEYLGVPETHFKLDLSIARGLDYYTGTIYETFMDEHPDIGSICSGGRYDNLAEFYTDKKLPGVGISIGLTRLYDQLTHKKIVETGAATKTKALILPFTDQWQVPLELAAKLRQEEINTELFLEKAKMKKVFNYAEKLGIPFVVIIGDDEIKDGTYTLKNITTREQFNVPFDELLNKINKG